MSALRDIFAPFRGDAAEQAEIRRTSDALQAAHDHREHVDKATKAAVEAAKAGGDEDALKVAKRDRAKSMASLNKTVEAALDAHQRAMAPFNARLRADNDRRNAEQAALAEAYNAGKPAHDAAYKEGFAAQVVANHAAHAAGRATAFTATAALALTAAEAYTAQAAAIRATPTYRPSNSFGFERAELVREVRERETAAKSAERIAAMWRETAAERRGVEDPQTLAEWSARLTTLRAKKPRPLAKLYGTRGPTPEQKAAHDAQTREWNKAYRAAGKRHAALLEESNAAIRAARTDQQQEQA